MPNGDIIIIKELADYLKIAEKTGYRFASEGKVPVNVWRFRKSDIDEWIKRQSDAGMK